MANDPSMPPSEQNPGVPLDNSPAMASPDMGAPAPADNNVMISMPKPAFDAMHAIVMQLASGLEQLKKNVDSQNQGAAAPKTPAAPAAPADSAAGEPSDEDFLKGLAEEGNKR